MSVSDKLLQYGSEFVGRFTKSKVIWLFKTLSFKDLFELLVIAVERGMLPAELVQTVAEMEGVPKTTSKNSSMPPSKDWKSNGPTNGKGKRRSGGQPGHKGSARENTDDPDAVNYHVPKVCHECHHVHDWSELDLLSLESGENGPFRLVGEYDFIELVLKPFITTRNRRYACNCPKCGAVNKADLPPGAHGTPFGPNLQSLVVLLKSSHHFSYKRIQSLFDCLGGSISEGALVSMVKRAGETAAEQCKPIRDGIAGSRIVASDETGCRVMNETWYQWVFRTDEGVCHVIEDSRGRDVIQSVLNGATPEIWMSDRYSSQQNIGEVQQTCLAHLARKVEGIVDTRLKERLENWCRRTFDFEKTMPAMKKKEIIKSKQDLDAEMDEIVKLPTDCKVSKSVQTAFANAHKDSQLLTFADFPPGLVPATNNDCERSLRHSVIMRKVIYCFRSLWGAKGYADIRSIVETAALTGKNPFQAIRMLIPP